MFGTESLNIDPIEISSKITKFISYQVHKSGLNGAIIAVSGGIDSALTLSYLAKALGPKRVHAITMPERDITSERDITDVIHLTQFYDVTCDIVDITPILDSISKTLPYHNKCDKLSTGNIRPRIRMLISYHYANTLRMMVVGSSNKTELLTGYFTKYGDGGVDLMPFGDLFKGQIKQLAKYMGIPPKIINKTPSAGLWPGQSDEKEMGATYDTIDMILLDYKNGYTSQDISLRTGADLEVVKSILNRVKTNEHKRHLPLILRLSSLT